MKKNFKVMMYFCIITILILLSKSIVFAVDSPHKLDNADGECAVCHVPHKAEQSDKIWAQPLDHSYIQSYEGIRKLCNSCHYVGPGALATSGTISYQNLAGKGNVFSHAEEGGMDHVMHGGAYISAGGYPQADSLRDISDGLHKNLDPFFPLDPNDKDTIPEMINGDAHDRQGLNYTSGGAGFYCGSCHDVHKNGGGAFLRYKDKNSKNDKPASDSLSDLSFGIRITFCSQCHGVPHADGIDCMECHAPHRGNNEIQEKELIARWILLAEVDEEPFASIGAIFPDPDYNKLSTETPEQERPGICYGCHKHGSAYSTAIATIDAEKYYHHPMGLFATKENSPRATGTTLAERPEDEYAGRGAWDRNNQLDCLSCHTYHVKNEYCEAEDNNSYLRWDFRNDSADFCIKCHNDKTAEDLNATDKDNHRQTSESTSYTDRQVFDNRWKTIPSKNCMFCHYIHDGKREGDRYDYDWFSYGINIDNLARHAPGDYIPAELDALMRVPAKVLPRNWAGDERVNDVPEYYEDMCYGCHARASIVDGEGGEGSLLMPDKYFSHRYDIDPNDGKCTNSEMKPGGVFPISDGDSTDTVDDYGVMKKSDHDEKEGLMYCGSCHNVHKAAVKPYLNGEYSPYITYPDETDGFCQGCHYSDATGLNEDYENFMERTHPIYKEPSWPATYDSLYKDQKYCDGGDGKKGAAFAGDTDGPSNTGSEPIICLSCHNVHAAMTNFDGGKAKKFDNPSSTEEQWDHGKLLVIDNNQNNNAQKSDLCIQCHPM